ncbi:MAG: TIGR02594 family protein [Prevotellaceae bacterium]|jgi:uncharacterized protein (TIGR02594 family)|nr:TIGR02594 family protein [Prevotellaceae bacterium]
MKKLLLISLMILCNLAVFAQNNDNPYSIFGYEPKISDVSYIETKLFYLHNTDTTAFVQTLAFDFENGNVYLYNAQNQPLDTLLLDKKTIARFTSIDPHAENYYNISPYAFCSGNPINRIDPTGMDWYETQDESGSIQAMWLKECQDQQFIDENGIQWNNIGTSYVTGNYRFEQYQNDNGEFCLRGINTGDSSTPWIDAAINEMNIGVTEIIGSQHNQRILEYHSTTGLNAKDDETAWCSSFVNWCFTQVGIEGTNSAAASSWANWGQNLENNPAYGSVGMVMKNGKMTHVGFTVGYGANGGVQLLGGNQSDMVKVSTFVPTTTFGNFRYPISYLPTYLKK